MGSRGDADRKRTEKLSCKVYIGNLGDRPPRKEDLEEEFEKFGKLVSVWIARSPPGFAYIEFEEEQDAKDAVAEMDGKQIGDRRIVVEMSHGKKREKRFRSRSRSRSRGRRYRGLKK